MSEIGRLSVRLGADTAEFDRKMGHAEQAFKGFANRMGEAAPLARQRAREIAVKTVEAMEQQFRIDQGRIKEGLARGLLTPAEARRAGREAAQAYNQGVISAIDRASMTRGAFTGTDGRETLSKMTGSLRDLDQASRSAVVSTGRMRQSLTTLATSALSTSPAVGSVASSLGAFAMGSGVMLGVLAGVSALSYAWRKLTSDARELRAEAAKAADEIERLAREEATGGLSRELKAIDTMAKLYNQQAKDIERLEQVKRQTGGDREAQLVAEADAERRLTQLRAEQATTFRQLQLALGQYSTASAKVAQQREREAKAETDRLKREQEEAWRNRTVSMLGLDALPQTQSLWNHIRDQTAKLQQDLRKLEAERAIETQGARFDQLTDAIARSRRQLDEYRRALLALPLYAFAPSAAVVGQSPEARAAAQRLSTVSRVDRIGPAPDRSHVRQAEHIAAVYSETAKHLELLGAASDALGGRFNSLIRAAGGLHGALRGGSGFDIATAGIGLAAEIGMRLFSTSPEIKESRRVQAANTQALERLRAGLNRMSDNLRAVAGRDIAGLRSATSAALGVNPGLGGVNTIMEFQRQLARLGITFEQAREIAQGFGVDLDGSVSSIRAFNEHLLKFTWADLFASVGGQLQLLQAEFQLFDSDAQTRLSRMFELFMKQSGVGNLGIAMPEINLNTPEGAKALNEWLQSVFTMMNGMTADQMQVLLGNMDTQQFLDFITQISRMTEEVQKTADALDKLSASMRNVPITFNAELTRYRTAMGQTGYRRADVPLLPGRTNGGAVDQSITTGDVVLAVSDRDNPAKVWGTFRKALRYGQSMRDPVATSITQSSGVVAV
jgi:hypothetical protein